MMLTSHWSIITSPAVSFCFLFSKNCEGPLICQARLFCFLNCEGPLICQDLFIRYIHAVTSSSKGDPDKLKGEGLKVAQKYMESTELSCPGVRIICISTIWAEGYLLF